MFLQQKKVHKFQALQNFDTIIDLLNMKQVNFIVIFSFLLLLTSIKGIFLFRVMRARHFNHRSFATGNC